MRDRARYLTARYGGVAITLHWADRAPGRRQPALGLSMVPLPLSPTKLKWYLWHKWIGITVFLVTGRAPRSGGRGTRRRHRCRCPPGSIAPRSLSHRALYALLVRRSRSRGGCTARRPASGRLPRSFPAAEPRAEGPRARRRAAGDAYRAELDTVHACLCPRRQRRSGIISSSGTPCSVACCPLLRPKGTHMTVAPRSRIRLARGAARRARRGGRAGRARRQERNPLHVEADGRQRRRPLRKWTANIVFLPADLAKSSASFDIELASIDLASADSESEVKGPCGSTRRSSPSRISHRRR